MLLAILNVNGSRRKRKGGLGKNLNFPVSVGAPHSNFTSLKCTSDVIWLWLKHTICQGYEKENRALLFNLEALIDIDIFNKPISELLHCSKTAHHLMALKLQSRFMLAVENVICHLISNFLLIFGI